MTTNERELLPSEKKRFIINVPTLSNNDEKSLAQYKKILF